MFIVGSGVHGGCFAAGAGLVPQVLQVDAVSTLRNMSSMRDYIAQHFFTLRRIHFSALFFKLTICIFFKYSCSY